MGYQALLFCPDEKLARVVHQVFSDLDFSVESVNEPFSAVKKLMAQRYDAIVVDCENEQNASLLFKSARNSSSNQSSLALALVEGQAGVAKAYRIGANLVLTKPINVEQAKGTLRVARGLLRKNVDAAPSSSPAKPAATPAVNAPKQANPETAAVLSAPDTFDAPTFESPLPAMAASAEIQPSLPATPVPAAKLQPAAEPAVAAIVRKEPAIAVPEKPISAPVAAQAKPAVTAPIMAAVSAAAPAPAREPALVEKRSMAPEFVGHASVSAAPSTPAPIEAPSFAALDKGAESDGTGGSQKIFIAEAAVLVLAALGLFGWSKFSSRSASTQAVSTPQNVATTPTQTQAPAQTQSAATQTQSAPAQTPTPSASSLAATTSAPAPARRRPTAEPAAP